MGAYVIRGQPSKLRPLATGEALLEVDVEGGGTTQIRVPRHIDPRQFLDLGGVDCALTVDVDDDEYTLSEFYAFHANGNVTRNREDC